MSGPQLSAEPRVPGSLAFGCCQGRGAIPLPAGMERGFARPEPSIAQEEDVGRFTKHIFEVLRGKHEPAERVPVADHSLHTHTAPGTFAACWQTIQPCIWPLSRNAQVSPSPDICGGVFCRYLGAPAVVKGASPCPCSTPRVPGLCQQQEGERRRGHPRQEKPFEETTPNKSGGFIQIQFCPGERDAFVGSGAAAPAIHLPPARAAGSGASGSSWPGRPPWRLPRVPARP